MIESIGNIASIAGFFLGIIYGIGLFIVTIHLTRYGITSVYLVQARYLVVGFVYLVHVLGMTIFSAPVALAAVLMIGLENSLYVLVPIGLIGLILLAFPGYSPKGFERLMQRAYKSNLNEKKYWRFWHVAMFCSLLMIWQFSAHSFCLGDANSKFFSISLTVVLLFTSTVYYTIFLYQSPISVGNPVLELIGAGQPIRIRLTVGKEKASGFQEYGLFSAQENLSNPVLLLDVRAVDIQRHVSLITSCILTFLQSRLLVEFRTWVSGVELRVPMRVLGGCASPRLGSAGCPDHAAGFNLISTEIDPIPASGQPKRSHPIRVPGDESLQGYADATSQTTTF